jgi:hypothetical protein
LRTRLWNYKFVFLGAGDGTQGLALGRQGIYQEATSPALEIVKHRVTINIIFCGYIGVRPDGSDVVFRF